VPTNDRSSSWNVPSEEDQASGSVVLGGTVAEQAQRAGAMTVRAVLVLRSENSELLLW
jgi:hypothetical protein